MAKSNNPENQQQLNINLPDEIAGGIYSNFLIVGHTPTEFVLDFVQILPGVQPKIRSRIIMSPIHAKRTLKALQDNIQKYEAAFGEIKLDENNSGTPPFPGFSGPTGFA